MNTFIKNFKGLASRFGMVLILTLLVCGTIVFPQMNWARGNDKRVDSRQFAVVMDGPIRQVPCDSALGFCLEIDLYSVRKNILIGKATFELLCSDPVFPPFPSCNTATPLLPGQSHYRDMARYELPFGTIEVEFDGWLSENPRPAENGGALVLTGVEEGPITGGTGIYKGASGELKGRIVVEYADFGGGNFGPFYLDKGLLLFEIHQ